MSAAMPLLCPMLPTTSKTVGSFNVFSEDIWRKIVDMDIVDNMSLVVVEKKVKSNTKKAKSSKAETKSGKKRKADTKSETEPTTKRRSSRRRGS